MGIDPGTAIVGYGVIEVTDEPYNVKGVGVIRTSKRLLLSKRLDVIYKEVTSLIEQFNPDEIAIEQLFFTKNVSTAMTVGHARGVLLLSFAHYKKPIFEYTPLQVKQGVTGYGKATKDQVTKMVCTIFNLKNIPKPDDAADALAIALCHANQIRSPFLDAINKRKI